MKPFCKQLASLLCLLLSLILLCGGLISCGETPPPQTPDPTPETDEDNVVAGVDMLKLMYFLQLYEEYSLQGFPEDVDLTEYIISKLLELTVDRYDAYLDPESYGDYTNDLAGSLVGIGVLVEIPQGDAPVDHILLLDAFTDSGAGRAGLEGGDRIIAINGVSVASVGYDAAVDMIGGEEGTTVEITYLRGDDPVPRVCNPVRGKCTRDSVYYYEKDGIGYVRITGFEGATTKQFMDAIDALEAQGVKGFVFDLRGNGGGLLRTVSEMLAYVLPDGKIGAINYKSEKLKDTDIYAEDGKLYMGEGRTYTKDVMGNPLNTDHQVTVPIAILTDGHTASASELFTSSIKETSQAGGFVPVTIVGQNTYGKGTSQNTFPLTDGSYLKLTIATYDPPSGVNYDGVGIAPDILVPDEEMLSTNQLYLVLHEEDPARVLAFAALNE